MPVIVRSLHDFDHAAPTVPDGRVPKTCLRVQARVALVLSGEALDERAAERLVDHLASCAFCKREI